MNELRRAAPYRQVRKENWLLQAAFGLGVLWLCGCGPNAGKSETGRNCEHWSSSAPELLSAPPLVLPQSHLVVVAEVDEAWMSKRLDQFVGRTLTSEKDRDVGAPGKASFKVTRKGPVVSDDASRLSISVPISADISVCKPIGSACLRYGACQPRFSAEFAVDNHLDDDFGLRPPRSRLTTQKRCVIGLDVTGEIEKIAKKELSSVEKQIKRDWPDLAALFRQHYGKLQAPVPAWNEQCARLLPEGLTQTNFSVVDAKEPKGGGKKLRYALLVNGTITVASDCSPLNDSPDRHPPPLKLANKLSETSELWIPEKVTATDLQTLMQQSLQDRPLVDQAMKVTAVRWSADTLIFALELSGRVCGTLWFQAVPQVAAGATELTFSNVTPLAATPDKRKYESSGEITKIAAHLTQSLRAPLPGATFLSRGGPTALLEATLAPVRAQASLYGLELVTSPIDIASPQLRLSAGGLYVLYPLHSAISVVGAGSP